MAAAAGTFDFILNTIAADHDTDLYMGLLARKLTLSINQYCFHAKVIEVVAYEN
jgi:hypothetical protein